LKQDHLSKGTPSRFSGEIHNEPFGALKRICHFD